MPVVTSDEKITVPQSVRRKAGIKTGDRVEFVPSAGTITIRVKRQAEDEYAPAERRAIDRMLALSDKDHKESRVFGPFNTAEEMAASVEGNIKKLRMAKRK